MFGYLHSTDTASQLGWRQLAGEHPLDRSALSVILGKMLEPLSRNQLPPTNIVSTSPDSRWSLGIASDLISGWSAYSLIPMGETNALPIRMPHARSTAHAWFRDSMAILVTGFPDAKPGKSTAHGPERMFFIDPVNHFAHEVPLPYPDDARLALTINQNRAEALITIREGFHKMRSFWTVNLLDSHSLSFKPLDCNPTFRPLQAWQDGFIGICDGRGGRGDLVYVRSSAAPLTIVDEQQGILRSAVVTDQDFFLVYYRDGHHQIIMRRLKDLDTPHLIYEGDLAVEELRVSPEQAVTASVSRLDVAPIIVPCTESALSQVSALFARSPVTHTRHEYPARDGTMLPVEIFHPQNSQHDNLLICVYGAWGAILDSRFDALRSAWLELGGSVACIGIRGGGERGAQWHTSGQGDAKKASTDDFLDAIARMRADESLKDFTFVGSGYSAGATVIASAIAREPSCLQGAVLESGVYDMQHYPEYGLGGAWKNEFGNPADQVKIFSECTPMNLARQNVQLPPLLVVSGARDQTVSPEHSEYLAFAMAETGNAGNMTFEITPDLGHDLNAPLFYPLNSPIRQQRVDMLVKELQFLLSIGRA